MSDFPRGWSYSARAAGGGIAAITLAAVPGVAHVLDSLVARLLQGGAAAAFQPVVTVTTGGSTIFGPFDVLTSGAVGSSDELSFTDLNLMGIAGNNLAVTFNVAAPANITENLFIQGHDI